MTPLMWQIAPAGIASASVCTISRRVPTPLLYDSRMPLANGAVFAGYTIVRLLGSGGMGEVVPSQASQVAASGRVENPS
jgi:hypothetical protein